MCVLCPCVRGGKHKYADDVGLEDEAEGTTSLVWTLEIMVETAMQMALLME